MAEDIGHWIGTLPSWLQLVGIPVCVILALLFVPVGGGGDSLGTMIIDVMTRKIGEKNDKK